MKFRLKLLVTLLAASAVFLGAIIGSHKLVPQIRFNNEIIILKNKPLTTIQKVKKSIVYIENFVVKPNKLGIVDYQRSSGTGVIVSADGLIVTNRHVVENSSILTVEINGRVYRNPDILIEYTDKDIAILKIDPDEPLPFVKFAKTSTVGEEVYAIGNPIGFKKFVSKGVISKYILKAGQTRTILTDALALPGSSGGGLFNMKGELVSVVTAIYKGPTGYNLGITITIMAKEFQKDLEIIREELL